MNTGMASLAAIFAGMLSAAAAAAPAPSTDPVSYGADPTGATDSTAALQKCLDAAGPGGTCRVIAPRGWRLKILGTVRIPKNTTLDCAAGFPDEGDAADYGNDAALLLAVSPTGAIKGESGSIVRNCPTFRLGMNFPETDAARFAGVAYADGGRGSSGFTVEDSVILGFDTGIWIAGQRPYIRHVTIDAAGVAKAALELDVGNTDSGYVTDVKIQPMATANKGCSYWTRPGTGLRVAGSPVGAPGVWLDRIVVQPFRTADYDFRNGAIIGNIWADGTSASCGPSASVGVAVAPGVALYGGSIDINGGGVGLVDRSGGPFRLGFLSVNYQSGDCIQLGDAANPGRLEVGQLVEGKCGGAAVHLRNPGSVFRAAQLVVTDANGRKPPYFTADQPTALGSQFDAGKLETDLGEPNPFAGFVLGHGAEAMIHDLVLKPAVACSGGLGSGACLFFAGDMYEGAIALLPRGTPTDSAGSVNLALPMAARGTLLCQPSKMAGSAPWPAGSTVEYGYVDPTHVGFFWNSPQPLAGGSTYQIVFRCWTQ